jgi:hypothetical protein
VLLNDIDARGARGRRGINLLLASALSEWRIRLREITRSPACKPLAQAYEVYEPVLATVEARVSKGRRSGESPCRGVSVVGPWPIPIHDAESKRISLDQD